MKKLLHKFASWLLSKTQPTIDIPEAVRLAFLEVGLPASEFSPSFDLLRAGKLADLLVKVAQRLDHDNQFTTVGDVIAVFQ